MRKIFPIKKRALEGILTPVDLAIKSRILVQHDNMNMERAVANQRSEYLSLSFSLLINSKVSIIIEIESNRASIRNPIGIYHLLLWIYHLYIRIIPAPHKQLDCLYPWCIIIARKHDIPNGVQRFYY